MRDELFKLCYIEGMYAYFTTRDIKEQWGDDWNDAPYEHNAGTPYEWRASDAERGIEPYEIRRFVFDGPFETPSFNTNNSRYSVEMINAGAIAWLVTEPWCNKRVVIPAGTTIPEFIRLVQLAGGTVYAPLLHPLLHP